MLEAETDSDSNWLLAQVSKLIRNIPGYDLLALAIGRDPLTGQAVRGDGLAWGKALAGLLPGGALLFENLEEAGVITRAVAWLKVEIEKLGITFVVIKDLFDQAWTVIVGLKTTEKVNEPETKRWYERLADDVKDLTSKAVRIGSALFTPEDTFNKLKEIFLPPINRVIAFIGSVGPKLMEFTFEGALTLAKAPVEKVMAIFNKGKGVLQQIITDPVGFLSNLLQAIHGGLQNFLQKFGTYLQAGLGGWLFGTLSNAGITFPAKLNLSGIFSLIAQILGVTWQAIKTRVNNLLGPTAERVIAQVEKTVAVVAEFITKGPIALYEMAVEFLGDLKTRFFDSVIEWARNTIIVKGVQKLIAMFNPVGAIVQAIITIGSTIKFFIDKAKEIVAFANAVFDSITEIAAGNLKKAIQAVEDSLAKALPMAISFMANLAGIGGIATKIKDVIKQLRQPIDRAVEKVVNFVADKARALMGTDKKVTNKEKIGSPEKTKENSQNQFTVGATEKIVEGNQGHVSKRLQYLGKTPGKSSSTGQKVIERMKKENKIKSINGNTMFLASDGKWYPIEEADMAHKVDAVTWWNNIGRFLGPKSKEVREWMMNPDNYYLEHYSINRSAGAKLKEEYLDPK